MNADAYFAMGKTHTVCQDYAGVRYIEGGVRVAVSDGCSSSPDTDFGSRFLVRAALRESADLQAGALVSEAAKAAEAVGLPPSCLDATLLSATVRGDLLTLDAYGDGVIDLEYRNGSQETFSIEFEKEAPAYPSYFLRSEDLDRYLEFYGTRQVTVKSNGFGGGVYSGKVSRETYGYSFQVRWEEVRRVTLCSDGVRSFRRNTVLGGSASVPLNEVMDEVTGIRSEAGAFMVRRMRKFLHDFCPKNGWHHDDDVAVATILNPDG